MSMSTSSAIMLTAAAGAATVLYFLVIARRNSSDSDSTSTTTSETKKQTQTKEQVAKASFRVHRANLMSISGRGNAHKKKHPGSKRSGRQGHQHSLHDDGDGDGDECSQSSWFRRLASFFKRTLSYLLSSASFGLYQPKSNELQLQLQLQKMPSPQKSQSRLSLSQSQIPTKKSDMETTHSYYNDSVVVGLDCEMVGGGRGGWKSLLARCSVVTLDCTPPPNNDNDNGNGNGIEMTEKGSLDQNLVVLYDKYVIPKGKITDYRTEWSGITKDIYSDSSTSPIPIVSFNRCQNEISQLFSSIEGKKVIVVGHALENDFDALEIEHPRSLTRDTAFYPPYMRRVRKKLYPRKLSVLTSEELDIEIQQKSPPTPTLTPSSSTSEGEGSSEHSSIKNHSMVGHSSVEDAAAALRLYWHKFRKWEQFLGHPLLPQNQQRSSQCNWPPIKLFLDGCNLPIGMRGVNFKELLEEKNNNSKTDDNRDNGTIPSKTFQLTSRKRDANHPSNISTIDWIPTFQSALLPQSFPKLDGISIMFDGAKFSNINTNHGKSSSSSGSKTRGGEQGSGSSSSLETRTFCLDSSSNNYDSTTTTSEDESKHGRITIEITEKGESADDVLFHICSTSNGISGNASIDDDSNSARDTISLDRAIDILSYDDDTEADILPHYIVIRRKAGGSKTHKRLFDKLHLRRPDEGALCLSALTPGLRKDSWKIARELKSARSIESVIKCELRRREYLRFAVVTDDVYLTDRLVGDGVLVLSFSQLMKMF